MLRTLPVYALGGESLGAPEDTVTAYWAALGSGADGLAVGVRLAKDGQVICISQDSLKQTTGHDADVSELTSREIAKLDAGSTFRSTVLDSNNQPTGKHGEDLPWQGDLPNKRRIVHPTLVEVLRLFARRTDLVLMLPRDWQGDKLDGLVKSVLEELHSLGCQNRVTVAGPMAACLLVREVSQATPTALYADGGQGAEANVLAAKSVGTSYLVLDIEIACPGGPGNPEFSPALGAAAAGAGIGLLLDSPGMPYAPTPAYGPALSGQPCVRALLARGVPEATAILAPPALVLGDNFDGTSVDLDMWSAGYSHQNQDTVIKQDDGFHITIEEGGSYSGGACLAVLLVNGRFDARTHFSVSNPQQGTTFELAAIGIDPGYHHMDNSDLNSRNVNLTFDVHGAPPYASSERDEDDGFRIGWNNGFNLARVSADWEADSVNMFNKYGRDVGNGDKDNPDGWLRLMRNGNVFTSFYKDRYNEAWVCSGAALVQNLGPDVCLRLAGKHWAKGGKSPPGNHITFHEFELYQF